MSVLDLLCCCLLGFTGSHCSSATLRMRCWEMSLSLCALLLMKLQFPLMAHWVGCLPFSTLFAGYLQNCFVPRWEKAPESSSLSSCCSETGTLSLHLKVCGKEMRPIPGQTREYGLSLKTLPIASTSCLYLHACEWCLDAITGFAWAKKWLSATYQAITVQPGSATDLGLAQRPEVFWLLACWWWVSV